MPRSASRTARRSWDAIRSSVRRARRPNSGSWRCSSTTPTVGHISVMRRWTSSCASALRRKTEAPMPAIDEDLAGKIFDALQTVRDFLPEAAMVAELLAPEAALEIAAGERFLSKIFE